MTAMNGKNAGQVDDTAPSRRVHRDRPALCLRAAELALIRAHACAAYPRECCGVLTRTRCGAPARAHRCDNLQQQLHDEDPGRHPRDARAAYWIDPQQLYDIIMVSASVGNSLAGFYHSHVDSEARFSSMDQRGAMVLGPEPDYPDAVHLVLSVHGASASGSGPAVTGQRCYAWDPQAREFVPAPLVIVA